MADVTPQDPEEPGVDPALPPHEPPLFKHPQWTVGIVLVFAVMTVFAGLISPIWFVIGSPFVLVLLIYLWVQLIGRR